MYKEYTHNMTGAMTAEFVPQTKKIVSNYLFLYDKLVLNMKDISKTDLAGFNALISLYMEALRSHKQIEFRECNEMELKRFIAQTHFTNVFH